MNALKQILYTSVSQLLSNQTKDKNVKGKHHKMKLI